MEKWFYGVTLLPREKTSIEEDGDAVVEAVIHSRQDLGWELVRKTARDDAEFLVFRRPV